MENKVKVEKFYNLKEKFETLANNYSIALENNDEESIKNLNNEYEDLKVILYSSENYFKEQSNIDLKNQIKYGEVEEAEEAATIKKQKKDYKDNKSYIDTVEKSATLEEYIQNTGRKDFTFVKRNFKKFVLVGSAAALLVVGLTTCKNKKTDKKTNEPITSVTTEATTEKLDNSTEKTENTTKEVTTVVTTEEKIELNPISDAKPGKIELKPISNVDELSNNNDVVVSYDNGTAIIEKTESLDPHIEDYNTEETVVTEIVKEETVSEPVAQDYTFVTSYDLEETTEKVVIIEDGKVVSEKTNNNETKNESKTENITTQTTYEGEPEAVEYNFKEEKDLINKEETIIVEEKEEKVEVEVIEEPVKVEEPTAVDYNFEEDKEENIIVEEYEVTTDININDIPIEEDAKVLTYHN